MTFKRIGFSVAIPLFYNVWSVNYIFTISIGAIIGGWNL